MKYFICIKSFLSLSIIVRRWHIVNFLTQSKILHQFSINLHKIIYIVWICVFYFIFFKYNLKTHYIFNSNYILNLIFNIFYIFHLFQQLTFMVIFHNNPYLKIYLTFFIIMILYFTIKSKYIGKILPRSVKKSKS